MSRFFSDRYARLTPYTPGEQPRDMQYIKLNTNESPFPPPAAVCSAVAEAAKSLQLYPDPDCTDLTKALAAQYQVDPKEILLTNGSDEVLNFAFMAFCSRACPAAFPDITYGFYPVFAALNQIPYTEIPLKDDFTIDPADYFGLDKTIFIANPNAPTGIALGLEQIEGILSANPDHVVVIDEAYVDFGAESCVPLIHKYDNLLVTQTFSKSRSMAGARLGFGIGHPALIQDLNTIKYSTNPYNINRMTLAAGIASLASQAETDANCRTIAENRQFTADALQELGFTLTEAKSNFLFAAHPAIGGKTLYQKLKARGILVRHFELPRIRDYNRITIGTLPQMQQLIRVIRNILEETHENI